MIQLFPMAIGIETKAIVLEPNIIIVDADGSGDYASINEAINNAKPNSTIYVKNGEYNETIVIQKNIELVGENKDYTIIDPVAAKNEYALCLRVPNTSIRNLTIKNRGPGIYSSGVKIIASNTLISNCNIYNVPVGVAIWSSNNTIQNCIFKGCTDEGIIILGDHNKILSCIFHKNGDGIELQHSSFNIISNCEFYENMHSGIEAVSKSNNKNIILNCKIHNNNVHGIYFLSPGVNIILNCRITDNKDGNVVVNQSQILSFRWILVILDSCLLIK